MNDSVLTLTQSKYYSPALNTAIFDGPFRIYFTQNDEPYALKIYYLVQQKLGALYDQVKDLANPENTIFIVLHPEDEIFDDVTEDEILSEGLLKENYNSDPIFVIKPSMGEETLEPMFKEMASIVESWKLAGSNFI